MNADTGHLIRMQKDAQMPDGYQFLPEDLLGSSRKKLAGKSEAYVSLSSGGKLSKWAAGKRRQKRKMAKKSRKQNR